MRKDCSKECSEIGKMKRHITALYIVLAIFVIVICIGAYKLETVITEHMGMKAQMTGLEKRVDIQRDDFRVFMAMHDMAEKDEIKKKRD
jgi:hypothetical protein